MSPAKDSDSILEYIPISKFAENMEISISTARYYAKQKIVPGAIKIGRRWFFRIRDVEEWLAEKHREQQPAQIWRWPEPGDTWHLEPEEGDDELAARVKAYGRRRLAREQQREGKK